MQNRKRDTDVQNRLWDSVGEDEGGMLWENTTETSIQVYYQGWNRSPAQVGCMRQVLRAGALGRPRGMGWGGKIGMGNTCKSMADSCQCMAKTTTIL